LAPTSLLLGDEERSSRVARPLAPAKGALRQSLRGLAALSGLWRPAGTRRRSLLDRVRAGRREDAVAPASYPHESWGRALEIAGERRLDGRPPRRFAQERLDLRVHITSLHGVASTAEHMRDGVDDQSLPRPRSADRFPRTSRSANSITATWTNERAEEGDLIGQLLYVSCPSQTLCVAVDHGAARSPPPTRAQGRRPCGRSRTASTGATPSTGSLAHRRGCASRPAKRVEVCEILRRHHDAAKCLVALDVACAAAASASGNILSITTRSSPVPTRPIRSALDRRQRRRKATAA